MEKDWQSPLGVNEKRDFVGEDRPESGLAGWRSGEGPIKTGIITN